MDWYKKSQFTMEIPTTLYHATFRANLSKIMKEGLVPGGGGLQCYEGCSKGVYLHSDPDVAYSFPETSDNLKIPEEWYEDIVVLVIDANMLDILSFDEDPELPPGTHESFIYHDVVPPSAIKDFL